MSENAIRSPFFDVRFSGLHIKDIEQDHPSLTRGNGDESPAKLWRFAVSDKSKTDGNYPSWGELFGMPITFVVRAETEEQARKRAAIHAILASTTYRGRYASPWLDPEMTTCTPVDTA